MMMEKKLRIADEGMRSAGEVALVFTTDQSRSPSSLAPIKNLGYRICPCQLGNLSRMPSDILAFGTLFSQSNG